MKNSEYLYCEKSVLLVSFLNTRERKLGFISRTEAMEFRLKSEERLLSI